MGYFNYFIKCIIRNIAYRLCKPKVLLTVLFSVAILFILHTTGYCTEWSQGEIEQCLNGLADVTSNQGVIISQLSSMGQDVSSLERSLYYIQLDIGELLSNSDNIMDRVGTIMQKVDEINTNIINIYNTLEKNQQELITELQTGNQKLLDELQQLRDALVGSESTTILPEYIGNQPVVLNGTTYNGMVRYKIPMEYKYTYKIKVTYKNTSNAEKGICYLFYDKNITQPINDSNVFFRYIGNIIPGQDTVFNITTTDYTKPYLYLWYADYFTDIQVTASIEGLTDTMNQNNQLQQENNALQQQQNQLQQEQNNLIKDDNVNTDGFEFATNNTDNPTEEGFNTLFTSIYNAFCNTSSAPLTITLPYVNETFTIHPNLVSNAMQKMRIRSCGNVDTVFLLLWCLSIYI